MAGALLDTHALYWLVSGAEELTEEALVAIGKNQNSGTLFVSPVTAWELAIAAQKGSASGRPQLGRHPPAQWFREAVLAVSAKVIPIRQRIAIEAAAVVTTTGHKDPGDCYLIATARVRKIPIVTRDAVMVDLAAHSPDYLSAILC